jgi:hypothetical protein
MTIDEVKKIQRDNELLDTHVVWIGSTGFAIAHTDDERHMTQKFPAALPLEDCPLHVWLEWQCDQPKPDGVYIAEEDGSWKFSGLTD